MKKLLLALAAVLTVSSAFAQSNLYSSGTGSVAIGTNLPTAGAALDLSYNTNSILLPVGTTGNRPTGVNGMLRYNSTVPAVEAYQNNVWAALTTGGSAATINLGTSISAANPQRLADSTTGFYSPAASSVAVTAGGKEVEQWNTVSNAVDYFSITPSITGNPSAGPVLGVAGTDTNVGITLVTKGSGNISLTPASGNTAVTSGNLTLNNGVAAIGTSSPTAGASLDLSYTTNSILLPVGTTGQRPTTGVNGMLRYNSTATPTIEAYVNNSWTPLSTGGSGYIKTVKTQTFTSSGTYTPSTGMLYCAVRMVGGGGGGGGANANSAGGGGGGAGASLYAVLSAAIIGSSQTVTIGSGGAAGSSSPSAGGSGGTTSLGDLLTASGGSGGAGNSSTGYTAAGGAGGTSTSGGSGTAGGDGNFGFGFNVSSGPRMSNGGTGGSSFFGGGGMGGAGANAGTTGVAPGSGGGGAASNNSGFQGGAGASGYVEITEYCSQ